MSHRVSIFSWTDLKSRYTFTNILQFFGMSVTFVIQGDEKWTRMRIIMNNIFKEIIEVSINEAMHRFYWLDLFDIE